MIRLNTELLTEAIGPELRRDLEQVESNIQTAVGQLVASFVARSEEIAVEYESGRFPTELRATLKAREDELVAELTTARSALAEAASAVEKALAKIDAEAVDKSAVRTKKSVEKASQTLTALNDALQSLEDKSRTFGKTAGGAIAGAVRKAITGGVL